MHPVDECKIKHIEIAPLEPLWKRVPTRDEEGRLLCDFMMIIPGLNKLALESVQNIIYKLERVFALYQQYIVLADLNTKRNILWISHRQQPGIGLELAAVIHEVIPQAKLVAQRYE